MFARLAFSTGGEYSTKFNLKRWMGEGVFFDLDIELDDFARPYYGEGMDTDASESIFIEGAVTRVQYFLKCMKNGKVVFGPFLDYRGAEFEGTDGTDIAPP
ncbi:MAG: hypothetical protein P1S46_08870 [bacterium]|nr:hypothetical protein [bacterium]MDT8396283.1 hypothetical protein [bacterium]